MSAEALKYTLMILDLQLWISASELIENQQSGKHIEVLEL